MIETRIAIDAMGGEYGVSVTVPAALSLLRDHKMVFFYLVGDEPQIRAQLEMVGYTGNKIEIIHTPYLLTDKDKPTRALRAKEKSSLYMAVELVKDKLAGACVSAGNTGALLLAGRHLLGTLPGIDKPAIVAVIPGASKNCLLLDVGANVDCKAQQLFQFAVMGSVLAESMGVMQPASVGLLNIGVEDYKGNEQVRTAASLLEQCSSINYTGYVEGNALFSGTVDVVVCDGFVGNVTIKSSAGVVEVVNSLLRSRMQGSLASKLLSLVSFPLIRRLQSRINPAQYNGASLLGLQGSIIKSHSNAGSEAFAYAIQRAITEAESAIPRLIAQRVAEIVGVSMQQEAAV
ncbi:MAG: phosphate acyltransferase PlsX [Pseudohongiellaceae bacterium]